MTGWRNAPRSVAKKATAPRRRISAGRRRNRPVSAHGLAQILVDLVEEAGRREPFLFRPDQQREVLRHETGLDRVDADLLQRRRELRQRGIVVELGAVAEAARPGEDRSDRIGRSVAALLIFAVVSRDRKSV